MKRTSRLGPEVEKLYAAGCLDSEMATILGVSRTRIGQIRVTLNLPKQVRHWHCRKCGDALPVGDQTSLCAHCRRPRVAAVVTGYCSSCGAVIKRASWAIRPGQLLFCNKRCYGQHFGRTHGWGSDKALFSPARVLAMQARKDAFADMREDSKEVEFP